MIKFNIEQVASVKYNENDRRNRIDVVVKGADAEVSFVRRQNGWAVSMLMVVNGRPVNDFGGGSDAKEFWALLDSLACSQSDAALDASRILGRSVFGKLFQQ